MSNLIIDTLSDLWRSGRKVKTSSSGWISGNAICCTYNGESPDTRGRGGLIVNSGLSVSYSCFNCKFKTSYQIGRPLSYKFRKLLKWLGATESTISQLVIESIRLKNSVDLVQLEHSIDTPNYQYQARELPPDAQSFLALAEFYVLADRPFPKLYVDAVTYVSDRKIDMQRYDFFYSPVVEHKLSHRVIVPFYYEQKIIGWTARTFVEGILPKYHSDHPSDFVFNLDQQTANNKFVIVCEGAFDAMAIDGVAVLGSECSEQQIDMIDNLGREVIVVPDFDKHLNKKGKLVWPGENLINHAIECGWSVSFPIWRNTCKDVSEAVEKYGKLFTLRSILDAKQTGRLKLELMKRKVFNE